MRPQTAEVLHEGPSATDEMGARFFARSEPAQAKRRETWAQRRETQREDVLTLLRRGMVPLAVADEIGISDRRVREYVHEFEAAGDIERLPVYLSLVGPPREREFCPHCGRTG